MAKLIVHTPPTAKLKTSGYKGEPTGTIQITKNGTFNVKTYAEANVDVQPDLIEKNISENGVYIASKDQVDGYSKVNVEVQLPLQEKTVSPSQIEQEVTPDSGIYGLSKVTISGAPLQNKTVTPNSSQQAIQPDSGYYGLAEVLVLAAGLPIDPESLTPLEFGVDSEGFYYTDEVGGGTPISFGRDSVGVYVKGEE